MSTERDARPSRRAVLAAAAGAATAATIAAIGKPATVFAGADGDVVLGAENTATTTTEISNVANESDVLAAQGLGQSIVIAGRNVDTGTGVLGESPGGHGVEGGSKGGVGVLGVSETGDGVLGHSTLRGSGVHGHSFSAGGVGVHATAEAGTAFRVSGRAEFSRSGRATVVEGRTYVDVDLRSKGGLAGSPLCFGTLLNHRHGTWVEAVRPNFPVGGKLRIYLNRAVTSDTRVAWFVLR